MKIAIDLDETVFYCNSLAYLIANKFFQRENLTKFKFSKMEKESTKSDGLINKIIRTLIIPCNYRKYKNVEGSVEAIKYLLSQGHDLYFISKRPDLKIFNNIVYKWFEENEIPVKNVILNCSNKVQYCKIFDIGILIDDSKKTCEFARKYNITAIESNRKEKDDWIKIVDKINQIVEKQNQTNEKSLANNEML